VNKAKDILLEADRDVKHALAFAGRDLL